MRPRKLFVMSALVLLSAVLSPSAGRSQSAVSSPGSPTKSASFGDKAASVPPVALLVTKPGALHTSLYAARPFDTAPPAPLATFTHLPGATVRGAVIPGTATLVATADTADSRDLSFNASLYRVAPHSPPEVLCDGVVHASRPLVTADGRVLVSRGTPGPEPRSARLADMRVDALTIDEVDPYTGMLRAVHTASGYLAFLAGSYGREVIVYRVFPGGADIVGVDIDTSEERTIVKSLPPFARDFSVDPTTGTVVYQGRHETDSRTWVIDRVDLLTLAHDRLVESGSMNMVPFAAPGGFVAYSPEGRGGLTIFGEEAPNLFGEGADWVLAASEEGEYLTGLHTVPGKLSVPFVVDVATGDGVLLQAPSGARVAVAGFFPASGGAL